VLSGAAHFAFPISSTALPHVQSGKVRALAVTSAQRLAVLPNTPTLVELFNTPDLALDSWFGAWAPAGTPPEITQLLFKAFVKVFEDPAQRAQAEAVGTVVGLSASPQEFTQFIQAETIKFDKIVKAAKLSVLQ